MDRKAMACCRHGLRRLTSSPRVLALLILCVLCFDRYIAPIRALLIDKDLGISWPALLVFLLNDSWISVMTTLGLLLLLFDVPHRDESQRYLLLRAGRRAWARGQLYYILAASAIYLVAMSLITLAWIAPWTEWTLGWSTGIQAFVDGAYEVYDSLLNYDPWILSSYSPLGALAIEMGLHYVCFVALGFAMCLINAAVGSRAGFLVAAAPAMVDVVITEYFGTWSYYFSPLTLTRLSCLDYGDGRHCPTVGYAAFMLVGLALILGLLFVRVYGRKEVHS